MIINEKLIKKCIKESINKLIVEKAKFTKAENFLKDTKNHSKVFENIKYSYNIHVLKDFKNDLEIKEEAKKNIENAFAAFLHSSPKIENDKVLFLDKSINRYVTNLSNIPEFGSNPFYDSPILLKRIKEKNNFSDQEAKKNLLDRIKWFTKDISAELIKLLRKSITHDLQRKLKSNFMEKNKDILESLNFVHYPYAFREYSETDTTGIGAVLEVLGKPLEFLKGTVVNSPDELAGIGYPKGEELRDSIGMGSELGGKIAFPYIGFLITGKITYFDEKDAQSSTYRSSFAGGQRDSSGFVRYPKDILGSMSDKVQGAYKTREELENYLSNFDKRFGALTTAERSESEIKTGFKKHNYGEAFIDNWTAVGMIAQWDLIVKKFREKLLATITGLELDPQKEFKQYLYKDKGYSPLNIQLTHNLRSAKQNLDVVAAGEPKEKDSLIDKNRYKTAKDNLSFEYGSDSIPYLSKKLGIQKEAVPSFIEDFIKNIDPVLEQLKTGEILYSELNNPKVKEFIDKYYEGDIASDLQKQQRKIKNLIKKTGSASIISTLTIGLEKINDDLSKFENIKLKSYDKNFNEYDIKIFTNNMRQIIAEAIMQLKNVNSN